MSRVFDVMVLLSDRFTHRIHPGSAILADITQRYDGNPQIYFENERGEVENSQRFEALALYAADGTAQIDQHVAMTFVPYFELHRVGTYDLDEQALLVTDQGGLDAWLKPVELA